MFKNGGILTGNETVKATIYLYLNEAVVHVEEISSKMISYDKAAIVCINKI